ncbi:ferrochelatase [Halarchaeum solikamskense]|uniref:ferrochelatase n=1 Tax=Halarchaeum nitratireducens TaxID=489913 RepID=UPI001B3AEA65|nr:ferrochelatase [Halarchaeum solikamskense]MBP2249881.1 ferrochelatase [Halarchaeum solikamskense]
MTTGVILLNFGEPSEPTREEVVPYLERIFYNNRFLEGDMPEEQARERSRELAEKRAPSLIEEYEDIGGSPLNPQAKAQVDAVVDVLTERGFDVTGYLGTQFSEPTIADAVEAAKADGVDRLVGLPIYPLCGPSTTVDALGDLNDAVEAADWDVPVDRVSGWHRHPTYTRLRADNMREYADREGLDLGSEDTMVLFSAHGTPTHYLDEGSRYDVYVEEFTTALAHLVGVDEYTVGYQNHENRDIPWTEPETEDVAVENDAERVVVEPVSFMHEQSETLSELDIELREEVEEAGKELFRVPVPHDDPRFADLLADLVEPFAADVDPEYYQLRECQCAAEEGAMCLNAPRAE